MCSLSVSSHYFFRNHRVFSDVRDRANRELHQRGNSKSGKWEVYFPPPSLCTDNGVMVAWTGVEMLQRRISHPKDDLDLEPFSRWVLGEPLPEARRIFRKRKTTVLVT